MREQQSDAESSHSFEFENVTQDDLNDLNNLDSIRQGAFFPRLMQLLRHLAREINDLNARQARNPKCKFLLDKEDEIIDIATTIIVDHLVAVGNGEISANPMCYPPEDRSERNLRFSVNEAINSLFENVAGCGHEMPAKLRNRIMVEQAMRLASQVENGPRDGMRKLHETVE